MLSSKVLYRDYYLKYFMDYEKNAITHLLIPLTCKIRDNKKEKNINDFESYIQIIKKMNELGETVQSNKLHEYTFKKLFDILQLKWTDPITVIEKIDSFIRKHMDPRIQFYYWAYRNRIYFNDDYLTQEISNRKTGGGLFKNAKNFEKLPGM